MKFFYCVGIVIAVVLVYRIHPLLSLYLDAGVRSRVQEAVTSTADENGWLLSGVSIKKINPDSVQLQYRSYLRGRDPVYTLDVSL